VVEYFISTHGARKGLADTALKTADAGYLTRRLVDVAQDVVVTVEDCGTILGLEMTALKEGEDIIEPLKDRIVGNVALEDVYDPIDGELLVSAGELIEEQAADDVEDAGIQMVKIRSVLTCEAKRGCCRMCYGRNLATMQMVDIGEAVGIIAAQSIGEPGTQLTLRTFHIGGTASRIAAQTQRKSKIDATIGLERVNTVTTPDENVIVTSREGQIVLKTKEGQVRSRLSVPYGASLAVEEGDEIEAGDLLFGWDPYSEPVVADYEGTVRFVDIVEDVTMREELDESTGRRQMTITEDRDKKLHPTIQIVGSGDKVLREFIVPVGAQLTVTDGVAVKPGDAMAKISREAYKTRDITGGLPRVAELFEARKPKDPAVITEIDGEVSFGDIKRGKRQVIVTPEAGAERTYDVPVGKHMRVHEGDQVRAGDRLSEGPINPHDILSDQGAAGGAGVPPQRDSGGLPPAGREDQRQAHRRDRAPDAPEGPDHRPGRHRPPRGRERRPDRVPYGQPGGDRGRREARSKRAAPSRDHEGEPHNRVVHLGGFLPGDHPCAHERRRPRCARRAGGSEGEHHHRAPDSRGDRCAPLLGRRVHGRAVVLRRGDHAAHRTRRAHPGPRSGGGGGRRLRRHRVDEVTRRVVPLHAGRPSVVFGGPGWSGVSPRGYPDVMSMSTPAADARSPGPRDGAELARWAAALVAGRPPGTLDAGSPGEVVTYLAERGLAGLAWSALRRGEAWADAGIVDALQGPAALAALRGGEALDAARTVREALRAEGVDCLIFKGAALVRCEIWSAEERPFSDVDLLLRPEDAPRGIARLGELGLVPWAPWDPRSLQWVSAFTMDRPGPTEDLTVTFDVHWGTRYGDLRQRHRMDADPLWADADLELGVPSVEGHFAMIGDHVFKHIHVMTHFSGLADLVRLLPLLEDREALSRHAEARRLAARLPRLMDVLEQTFEVPSEAFDRLPGPLRPSGRRVPSALELDRLMSGPSAAAGRGGGLLLRWAMGARAAQDLRDVLLPEPRWLEARYPARLSNLGRRVEHLRRVAQWLAGRGPSPVSPNQEFE
jgi:hypothetical protein